MAEPGAAQAVLGDHLFPNARGEAEPEEAAFPLPAPYNEFIGAGTGPSLRGIEQQRFVPHPVDFCTSALAANCRTATEGRASVAPKQGGELRNKRLGANFTWCYFISAEIGTRECSIGGITTWGIGERKEEGISLLWETPQCDLASSPGRICARAALPLPTIPALRPQTRVFL